MDNNVLYLLFAINIISFLLGFIFSKILIIPNHNINQNYKSKIFNKEKNNVIIDDKKIVTKINTSGMEKKYETLGDTKKTQENITDSVNKLKSMKG
jgi:hypothetical protein